MVAVSVTNVPGDAKRLGKIALSIASHGVSTVATNAARRPAAVARRPRRAGQRSVAVALRRSFVDLGPTFVKFGQLIASSPGLFPAFLADEFRQLLDDVPPEPGAAVRRVIELELGQPVAELFASFDDEPVAAASVAQVHRATLHDGTEVAVKVRRPNLRRRMERDLRLLRVAALGLERAGSIGAMANPVAIVDDLADTVRAELDFRREAEAMVEFARVVDDGGHTDVVVPSPIPGLVSERVLVMTYVEGTPVDHGEELRAAGHDLERLLRTGIRAWLEGALGNGLFHGDVHAGNLFITPDGKVAFLDFGIMGRLDEHTRGVLRSALPALLVDEDYGAVVKAIFDLGAGRGRIDVEAATADVAELLAPMTRMSLGDLSYAESLAQIVRVASEYQVRLPRELVLVIKQLLYFERYAKDLAPDYVLFADEGILGQLMGGRELTAEAIPELRPRPVTRENGDLLAVEREGSTRFSWQYESERHELTKLYEKAKRSQWNATTDIDWSVDVDPLDSGGLASYLPMIASASFAKFDERQVATAGHHFNAWLTSQFLHGEQGALLATSKLVREVPWTEAKFYGASQVIDEARHVEAYARYLDEKLELQYPVNDNLRQLLEMVVSDPRWDITYLGMQIIVEGIALAAFGLIHQYSTEPLIKQITRYVMADEARHVAFGALSLAGLYDDMTAAEVRERENFVVEAAWLMRNRFLAEDVWVNLGIPLDDGLRDSENSPMLQLFQRILFAKITPNLRKIGLMSPHLAERLVAIGAMGED